MEFGDVNKQGTVYNAGENINWKQFDSLLLNGTFVYPVPSILLLTHT